MLCSDPVNLYVTLLTAGKSELINTLMGRAVLSTAVMLFCVMCCVVTLSCAVLSPCHLLCLFSAGKSELINSLMGRPVLSTSAFRDSTRRVRVVKGNVAGAQSLLSIVPS